MIISRFLLYHEDLFCQTPKQNNFSFIVRVAYETEQKNGTLTAKA